MSEDKMLDGVRTWLEASGRGLELRAARAFRKHGAKPVAQSFLYVDPETQKQREGDVLAHYGWSGMQNVPCTLTAVVECKSSRNKPWVAFYDRSIARGSELENWVAFAHGPFTGITQPLADLWVGQPPFNETRVATHVAAAHVDESNNPANDAVRQVMSGARAQRAEYIRTQNAVKRALVVVPVVVTAAPLVKCELDSEGEVQLESIASFVASGGWEGGQARRVFVLNESAVPEFSADLRRLADLADQQASGGLLLD